MIIEEAKKYVLTINGNNTSKGIEDILSRPAIYTRLNCFPKEISAI
jgi:hypothetical protein